MPKRILVCGGRKYSDKQKIYATLDAVRRKYPDLIIIEGDCRGADRIAGSWARRNNVPCEVYPADWKTHGLSAGPKRNQLMLDTGIDAVIAFHADITKSKGTADMVKRARKAKIFTWVHT